MNDRSVYQSRGGGYTRGPWIALLSALLTSACPSPDGTPPGTSGPTAAESVASSADATTSGATTTAAPGSTTVGATIDTNSSTTGEGSGDDEGSTTSGECPVIEEPTTGELNPLIVDECDTLCAHYQECGLKEHALCVMGCIAKFGYDHEECQEAGSAARMCLTGMTCEELGEHLKFNRPGPCAKPLEGQEDACNCQTLRGTGEGWCMARLDCPYVPNRRITCSQDTCKCFVGDEVVKTCPKGNACEDLHSKAESCCCMFH